MVYSGAISPNEKYVIAAFGDNTILLWDIETKKYIKKFSYSGFFPKVLFSSDSKRVIALSKKGGSSYGYWDSWDVETEKCIKFGTDYMINFMPTVLSEDRKIVLIISEDRKTADVHDTETGKVIIQLKGDLNDIWSVGLSSDGKTLFTGSYHGIIGLWKINK